MQFMVETILTHFKTQGTFVKAERFGSGLIHDTWLCSFTEGDTPHQYILQRINTAVFQQPQKLMENMAVVTSHIVSRLRTQGVAAPEKHALSLVPAWSGKSYVLDSSREYWRVFPFIDSGGVFDTVGDPDLAYEIGRGLGGFHALVSDLPTRRLNLVLRGFHHTQTYLKECDDALREDTNNRAQEVQPEIAFIKGRISLAQALTAAMDTGRIPLRVVHNDPKVNNVLVHVITRKAICMIDLDTVMPGLAPVDFGDCIRSACNPAGEDAKDFSTVRLDLQLFEALAGGYLGEARAFLTENEIAMLPLAIKVVTFELGLRFFTDYLCGDTYFKITYPDHNLHRARVQFLLLESIEKAEGEMASIVKEIQKKS